MKREKGKETGRRLSKRISFLQHVWLLLEEEPRML